MPDYVKPTLPGGFRDYPPAEMLVRNRMLSTIRSVFARFGFDPLETPGVERKVVLTGNNPNFRMNIFNTQIGNTRINTDPDLAMAMRFDLTVPLARFIAANPELPKPFKRYQIGNVWRGEKPQAGRFREFMQFDADIVGSDGPLADAEIVALMVETMLALVGDKFTVRFNTRRILNGLPGYAGYDPALNADVLRIIDKLPKIGRDAVLRELSKPPKADAPVVEEEGADQVEAEYGLGLSTEVVDKIGAFIDLQGTTDELLTAARTMFTGVELAEAGIAEISAIVNALRSMGVPEQNWQLDLSVARGLAYYTGPVFETFLNDLPSIGSVFSGGRYDDLVNRFMEGNFPATGASVGVDRLFAALKELNLVTFAPTATQVLVTTMDADGMSDYLAMTGELRQAGLCTQLWLGQPSFKEQLAYAAKMEIPVVIIVGSNERRDGTVTIKDMRARKQQIIPRSDLLTAVKAILDGS